MAMEIPGEPFETSLQRQLRQNANKILKKGSVGAVRLRKRKNAKESLAGFKRSRSTLRLSTQGWFRSFVNETGFVEARSTSRSRNFRYIEDFEIGGDIVDFAFPTWRIGFEIVTPLVYADDVREFNRAQGLARMGWFLLRVDHGDVTRARALLGALWGTREHVREHRLHQRNYGFALIDSVQEIFKHFIPSELKAHDRPITGF